MAEVKIKEKLLPVLTCAAETNTKDHICENPVFLSCGHHICKTCIQPTVDHKRIKCKICNQLNERNISVDQEPVTFNLLFNDYFDKLCLMLFEDFKTNFETVKQIITNHNEAIDMHVEQIKDQIDIRIESLKTQLDDLRNSMKKELEQTAKNIKDQLKVSNNEELFDEKCLKNELDKWESYIANKIRLSNTEFYDLQRKLESLKKIIDNNTLNVYFQESDFQFDQHNIGKISCFESISDINNNEAIFKRIKDGKFECVKQYRQNEPFDMCVLPNGNLMVAHRGISIYDTEMNLIKTMDSLHGLNSINMLCVNNEQDEIYCCNNYEENRIIKIDSQLNKLNEVRVKLDFDCMIDGMCFYNNSVYICVADANELRKYDSNLAFQNFIRVNFFPQRIKNIKNIACITCDEGTIFYNLDTFTEIRRYEIDDIFFGVVGNAFYQYSVDDHKLTCYKSNGEFMNEIVTNDFGFHNTFPKYGAICLFNSNLVFCHSDTPFIVII